MTTDYDWNTFREDMDGAKVNITLDVDGGSVAMKAVTTTVTGKTYTYSYNVSGLPVGVKGAYLSMEKAHIVVDNTATGVVE